MGKVAGFFSFQYVTLSQLGQKGASATPPSWMGLFLSENLFPKESIFMYFFLYCAGIRNRGIPQHTPPGTPPGAQAREHIVAGFSLERLLYCLANISVNSVKFTNKGFVIFEIG